MHRKKTRRWPKLLALSTVLTSMLAWLVSPAVQATATGEQTVCAEQNCSVTFPFSNQVYLWQPPADAVDFTFEIRGAQGGGDAGGYGGRVTGRLNGIAFPVQIRTGGVGSVGNSAVGGFNGGGSAGAGSTTAGSGGGATDIRTGDDLGSRVAIAAGGGGQGAVGTGNGTRGGGGGGYIGLAGFSNAVYGGGGATQARGGYGGVSENGGGNGANGVRGVGGAGGSVMSAGSAGGGGGAGYWGGGGGAANGAADATGGTGGGGGSSFADATYVTDLIISNSINSGNGYAVISYRIEAAALTPSPEPSASPEPTPSESAQTTPEPTVTTTPSAEPSQAVSDAAEPTPTPEPTPAVTSSAPQPQATVTADNSPVAQTTNSLPVVETISTPAQPEPEPQPESVGVTEPELEGPSDSSEAQPKPDDFPSAEREFLETINSQISQLAQPTSENSVIAKSYRWRFEPEDAVLVTPATAEPSGLNVNRVEAKSGQVSPQILKRPTAAHEDSDNPQLWQTALGAVVLLFGAALFGIGLYRVLNRQKARANVSLSLPNQLKMTVR